MMLPMIFKKKKKLRKYLIDHRKHRPLTMMSAEHSLDGGLMVVYQTLVSGPRAIKRFTNYVSSETTR